MHDRLQIGPRLAAVCRAKMIRIGIDLIKEFLRKLLNATEPFLVQINYSILILAALTICDHREISFFINEAYSSGGPP